MSQYNLTNKEQVFVETYLSNGFNGAAAYRQAYNTDNNNTAKAEAWKLLNRPKVKMAIEATEGDFKHLSRKMRLSRSEIVKNLRDLVYGDNPRMKLEAIKTVCKLCGDFAPDKQEVTVAEKPMLDKDISKMTKEEIEKYRQQILAEL